jgi:diguanylate cyclase (GGDEF)-like protein/PAS domain S-box-containing protein
VFDANNKDSEGEGGIQDVLARMPVGVAWADANDGRILYVNRKFTTMFGYELADLKTVHDWIERCYANPEQGKSVDEFWALTRDGAAGESSEMDEIELEIRCKNGAIKTVLSGKIMLPNQSGALSTFLDITPRKEKENLIRRQALEDPLTGLLNRRAFTQRMEERLRECEEAAESGGMALLLIDLDGFKQVNDTFGHPQGDVLLQKVAERLKQAVRDNDTLCRIGGDEFGVVLHSVNNEATASHVAERILYGLTRRPYELGQTDLDVGASIGIAIYPEDGVNEIDLFRCADQALYRAKYSGKGRWSR